MMEHVLAMRAAFSRPYPDETLTNTELRYALMDIANAMSQPSEPRAMMVHPTVVSEVLTRLGIRSDFLVRERDLTHLPEFEWNDD